jgi:hypothetical protein
MIRLVRIYHSARDAARATGHAQQSIMRAAKLHGVRFRHERSLAEDPRSDARYLKE